MDISSRILLLLTLLRPTIALPSVSTSTSPPTFVFPGDAPYNVPTSSLSSILTCPHGTPSSTSRPILLIHGTGTTGTESWSGSYVPALTAHGYAPCYLTLPDRELDDMQLTASYIAYNVHYLSHLSGTPLEAVISHSQGNPNTQWALHFWPSTHAVVKSYIGLAPDLRGAAIGNIGTLPCFSNATDGPPATCQPALWQQRIGSKYMAALAYRGLVPQVSTTTIWTMTDEAVDPPAENAWLPNVGPGASVVAVQDVCPGRVVDHFEMLVDAVVFAVALDALEHGGLASAQRVRRRQLVLCAQSEANGMNETLPGFLEAVVGAVVTGLFETGPRVLSEPPLKTYAQIKNQ